MAFEPRIEDKIEETHAQERITEHLAGKPIVGTSGNDEHQLTPKDVKVRVTMSKDGDELAIIIPHSDRHHPSLVYDTLVKELSALEELKTKAGEKLEPKAFDAEKDYIRTSEKGLLKGKDGPVTMVIRYDVPGGEADDVIHALSKNHQDNVPLPEPVENKWADRVETVAIAQSQAANQENWATKALNYLGAGNSRG